MGLEGKELEELYLRQYTGAVEENRLFYTKANETEFILTKHYIHKYLKPGAKVLDVGAGCGVYTKALADEGFNVDAIDLHPDNFSRMKELFRDRHKAMHWICVTFQMISMILYWSLVQFTILKMFRRELLR